VGEEGDRETAEQRWDEAACMSECRCRYIYINVANQRRWIVSMFHREFELKAKLLDEDKPFRPIVKAWVLRLV
jgi:hypothetical protein